MGFWAPVLKFQFVGPRTAGTTDHETTDHETTGPRDDTLGGLVFLRRGVATKVEGWTYSADTAVWQGFMRFGKAGHKGATRVATIDGNRRSREWSGRHSGIPTGDFTRQPVSRR